jgi:hypothetical protein
MGAYKIFEIIIIKGTEVRGRLKNKERPFLFYGDE